MTVEGLTARTEWAPERRTGLPRRRRTPVALRKWISEASARSSLEEMAAAGLPEARRILAVRPSGSSS